MPAFRKLCRMKTYQHIVASNFLSTAITLGVLLSAAFPVSAASVSLKIEQGVLVGAKNVSVNGRNYDVDFIDGTCATAYEVCSVSAFTFDYDGAVAASWALLESVFIDSSAGAFGSAPYRIRGCVHDPMNFGYACMAYTAAYFELEGIVTSAVAINQPSPSQFTDWVISGQTNVEYDFAPYVTNTWAVWRPSDMSSEIPEPASYALVLAALGIGTAIRRRR